jgi:hypothetical protein
MGLWFALCLFAVGLATACGSGETSGTDGDVIVDGDGAITCVLPEDCPVGMFCSFDGICMDSVDGDVSDGDFEQTRVLRSVPEETVDFGDIEVGSKPEINVTLFNDGNSVLHLFDANWLAPLVDNPFVLSNYMEASIQPGQSYTFSIRFEPKELGEVAGLLRINNDSTNQPELELNIAAKSVQPAGNAEIGSSPEAVEFEDQALGRLAAQVSLRIGNMGDGASQIILTSVSLLSGSGGPFTLTSDNDPSEEEPVVIAAGQSAQFRVFFAPIQVGEFTDTVTVEYHTSSDDLMQVFDIPVSGKAVNGVIVLQPSNIDFGAVTLGSPVSQDLRIINNNPDETITISSVQIRMPDGSNWRAIYSFTDPPAQLALAPAARHDFSLEFTPLNEIDYSAELVVTTNYQGQTYYFPITASGSAANKKPIARIAQRANGPDINLPIDLPTGSPLQFFGDISYDPDGDSEQLTYEWFLQKPASSVASLAPNASSPVVNTLLDVAGAYMLTLVVTDEQGLESDPKSVIVNADAGVSSVMVEAIFNGISGESDVDLTWITPIGTSCNESNVAANGYCQVPQGYGSARFEGCSQASVCTTERVTHVNAPDGNYQIRILFDEDCSKSWPEDCLLWGSEDAEVDIIISVDGQQLYRIDNERLTEQGDQSTWNLRRQGGIWQEPERATR